MDGRIVCFVGGATGPWHVTRQVTVKGAQLSTSDRIYVADTAVPLVIRGEAWQLKGVASNLRYTSRHEVDALTQQQKALGQAKTTCSALIPIQKNAAWWSLAQDERREILEKQSQHISIGLRYVSSVARKLYHCRDIDGDQPFDFLTWFEFEPRHTELFNELLELLRTSPEWNYVEREVEIRCQLRPDQHRSINSSEPA